MDSATAFSPGHVTGFFSIRPHSDPLHHGSLGAGFSLALGTTTRVRRSGVDSVRLNGKALDATVSQVVLRLFRTRTGWSPPVSVDHQTPLPVGCGFGTSGAGALSLALALNELAGTPLTTDQAGSLAHLAEIECGTGLGTVLGESYGGFKASLEPGAPGVGKVQTLPTPEGLTAVFVVLGPLATPAMLGNPAIREAVNREGEALRLALLAAPDWRTFLALSVRFGSQTALVGPQLTAFQAHLASQGWTAPMLMFGNGLFTLVEAPDAQPALASFQGLGVGEVFSSQLDLQGGRLLHAD
jgi:pantoate kinase